MDGTDGDDDSDSPSGAGSDGKPGTDRPEWWNRNAALRDEMGLPDYEPPRFADGVHTHEVVDDIETVHDCDVRFVGHDTRYPDDWVVQVDGAAVMGVGRHRDTNGNTVFEVDSETFVETVLARIESAE